MVMDLKLKPFQREFERAVENPAYDTVALSGPRGLGKTFIAGRVLRRALTPGDVLFQKGKEVILGAASLEQARLTYAFIRAELDGNPDYRFIDSVTRLGITHIPTNTKLRAISSNAKTSFGIVGVPLAVIDEPGALEISGGQMLWDSLATAQGKVGSPLKVILIGTLAPMAVTPGHWWYDLIHAGTRNKVFVQHFRGELDTWDSWQTIRKANPLVSESSAFREKLLAERDEARHDTRLKSRFLSYRLNIPSSDSSKVLLTVDDFQRMLGREVPDRQGRPIVAVDLGGGRAWSAAVAVWRGGRVEALAVAPGIPSLEEQEKRDRQPAGSYRSLAESGQLMVAEGLRVQPPAALWDAIRERWGVPVNIICDRFRLGEMQDAVKGATNIEPRMTRWSESGFDIRALRKLVSDGPFSVAEDSRLLLAASLSVAMVKNDDAGNVRLVKRGTNNTARDDAAAALILVSGAYQRAEAAVGV